MSDPRGVWIYILNRIDPNYVSRLKAIGVGRVYLKVMDGASANVFWANQCSTQIVGGLHAAGIEVFGWGYHYAVADPANEIAAVKSAMACGLDGYVVDIEKEAEVAGAAAPVNALLTGIRPLVPPGRLGYTSFGAPQFHRAVPWQVLNQGTDFAMPQIYFELFSFGSSNAEEVLQCVAANKALPGIKTMLPIWSSEAGARTPASAAELQGYLDRFPGSSIWRLPGGNEAGEAWNLRYDTTLAEPADFSRTVQAIHYVLRPGAVGADVATVRALLQQMGYASSSATPDMFDDSLEQAVRQFQTIAGIGVDGKVGPETIKALTGQAPAPQPELGKREQLALVAQQEGDLHLRWANATSAAEKYLAPLRPEMQRRGQIGMAPVFYNWCGAFVLWCCREAGFTLPDAPPDPPNYFATFALVEAWVAWAKAEKYWLDKTAAAARGDIVIFNWFNGGTPFDHIGIVSSFTPGSAMFRTSEGNSGNITVNQTRDLANVVGFVRLPA
jgi:Putative peptidoglycan binding domain/CHAP domain